MRTLGSAVNADYDLTGSGAAIYNATPDASNPRWVAFDIAVGDGTKNLDGTGGDFTLDVTIGGVAYDGASQTKTVDASTTRLRFQSVLLLIPANAAVVITLTSPNGSDTDVDVTVQPYDVAPLQPSTVGRTIGVESDGDLTKVNTLDGHTAQTGDSYARLGAPAGASVSADIATVDGVADGIKAVTDNLPNSGALTTIDANIDAILADTGTDGVVLSTATVNAIADGLLDRTDGVEPSSAGTERTVREALRIILSACAGKASGLGTTTANYRDTNDSKNRISATVDADGNRSAVTLDDT